MTASVNVTDLPLSAALGIIDAPANADHVLEMPVGDLTQNHVGSVHAAAQFALAEAASASALQRAFPELASRVVAVVRGVSLKYRRPATTRLRAFAWPDEDTRARLVGDLAQRLNARAVVHVELKDDADQLTFAGDFVWFVSRQSESV